MERTLKQRLVGAGVIVALGVVFIPMFLDGSGEKVVREIPLPPAKSEQAKPGMVKPETIPVPDVIKPDIKPVNNDKTPASPPVQGGTSASGKIAGTTAPQAQPSATKTEKAKSASTTSSADKKPVQATISPKKAEPAPATSTATAKTTSTTAPRSWVVQVGSFGENSKAIKLRDRLRKKKYHAFVESVKTATGNPMYRVRVGPVLKRADAETMQKKLASEEKIKGYVTHHP